MLTKQIDELQDIVDGMPPCETKDWWLEQMRLIRKGAYHLRTAFVCIIGMFGILFIQDSIGTRPPLLQALFYTLAIVHVYHWLSWAVCAARRNVRLRERYPDDY